MNTQLTAREVAALLKVSERGFEGLIAKNEAPPFYRLGRSRRWDPDVVKKWITERSAVAR